MFGKDTSVGISGVWYMFKFNSVLSGKYLDDLTERMATNKLGPMLAKIMGIEAIFLKINFPFFNTSDTDANWKIIYSGRNSITG